MPSAPPSGRSLAPIVSGALVFAVVWAVRLAVSVGPLHDEAITLLAANAAEGRYAALRAAGHGPFGEVVPASEWQQFTTHQGLRSFARIREDLHFNDLHPPLAFWVYNRWLHAAPPGEYREAVFLSGILVLLSGLLLHTLLRHLTGNDSASLAGALLFYLSEATISTALYARQYALLDLVMVLTLVAAVLLVDAPPHPRRGGLVAAAMGGLCLAGMLTQYLYALTTTPLHAGLVGMLYRRRAWRLLATLLALYGAAAAAFAILMPHALSAAKSVTGSADWRGVQGSSILQLAGVVVPFPGSWPIAARFAAGTFTLLAAVLAVLLIWRTSEPAARLVLAALGASTLAQTALVTIGALPAWSSEPHHMSALVILLAVALATGLRRRGRERLALAVVLSALLVAHGAYAVRRLQTEDHSQRAYLHSLHPDVVLIEGLERGEVLPLTLQMPPDQRVLVASSPALVQWLGSEGSMSARSVLWLTVPTRPTATAESGTPSAHGWKSQHLATPHQGLYEAFLLMPEAPR